MENPDCVVLSELKGRAQQQHHHSSQKCCLVAELGEYKRKMECKQRVSDPEHHPWMEPPCWFKTCISGVVEKRLIYSIITYQHEEYDQDRNIAQSSKRCLSGDMPVSQSLKTDRANKQVFLASTSHPFLKNSGLVFSGS